ncbi:TrmH family RNA methyltransferase, partial [Bordetella pertussis]|uniref:TrmH family RNA methyltransferase n=1 Tax=Bordetella pertussis TaxID=520 RepID=UPI002916CD83
MTQAFSRVRFIMTQPSHPGNVGSAARAIKTMGFGELVLVAPRFPDMTAQPEAVALASGALDVLERAAVHDTLEEALAPVTLAFALTTRVLNVAQALQLAAWELRYALLAGTGQSLL